MRLARSWSWGCTRLGQRPAHRPERVGRGITKQGNEAALNLSEDKRRAAR
jgi:hypothetical protein